MTRNGLHTRTLDDDIDELSGLLEEVLTTFGTEEGVDAVESVQQAAIRYRDGDIDSRDGIKETIANSDAKTRATVTRALTTYFILTNLAEERERVRALRRGQDEGTLADSLEAAIQRLDADGAEEETVEAVLSDVLIQPTFTAHPTEANRKTIKAKLRESADILRALDERVLTDQEEAELLSELRSEVATLWQTAMIRDRRPDVTDEARNVQWYLENILFEQLGEIYDALDTALADSYGTDIEIPTLYEFRSWAGSDRDGNPYVTPAVTEETLERQRSTVLGLYAEEVSELLGTLSAAERKLTIDEEFETRFDERRAQLPDVAAELEAKHPNEPHRQFLELVREELERVAGVLPGGYDSAEDFRADIDALDADLRANGAAEVADIHLQPLQRKIQTFGFSLASLDLRDHREKHTAALSAALERVGVDYAGMDESERVNFLTEAILQDRPVLTLDKAGDLDDETRRVLERFDRLADWQKEYGQNAIDTYCISMCEEPSHVLEVLFLADQAGIADLPTHCGLDIVPLLETESALSGARRIMGTLFENDAYTQALAARDNTQEIMLGYSDSNKENGFLAANWSLYRNQRRLAEITSEYGIDLRLFHGRGGSISRGGGPMNDALLSLPTETVTGEVKFTEQGEVISEKYANSRIARRNLEQMLNAQIRARYRAINGPIEEVPDRWQTAMETAADAAREAYRDLLETDRFVEYFESATPITVIEDLNLGSRPASRSGERTVEDLRAIPWVFSWTQARCILPGWYALATGFRTYIDNGGDMAVLQEMYEEWPFFQTTIDNASLALARSDMEIAAEYAALAPPELQETFFERIRTEYDSACQLVKTITGREELLDRAWLREGFDRRNPYIDPLNLLQVQLLDKDGLSELEELTLRKTVKGIASGLQNTG